jgi:hypothetical protein
MNPNTINQVTGILQLVSNLEPAGFALVQKLMTSTQGMSAADIAAMVHTEAQSIAAIADQQIRDAGGTP